MRDSQSAAQNGGLYNRLHSIAVQLFLLFFVSIIVPVLIGGYLSYEKSAVLIEEQVSNVATLTIRQVSDKLNFIFKGLDNTSMRLVGSKLIQDALQGKDAPTPYENVKLNNDAKDQIISLITNSPEIMDIFILDVNKNNSLVSSGFQGVLDPWETEWYRKIIEANGAAVWFGLSNISYLKGTDMGIPVFGLGRSVKDVDTGKVLGVMFIEVRGKVLKEAMADLQFGQTGYTYVVDQTNSFAYHPDMTMYGKSSELELPAYTRVVKINGTDTLVIPDNLSNGWQVAGIVPIQELIADSKVIRDLTVWIALASVLVAVVMGYYVAYKIGRPLVYLSKLMKRSEAGDLTVRANIAGRNEIGQLGRSFNKMIRQIGVLIHRIAEEENEKKKAEIRALRYQINPHFLYNTLNSIRWMARLQRTDDVADAISALVPLLEGSLERNGSFVKLGEDFDLLNKYMIIQQYRYDNKLTLTIHCPPELNDIPIPRMLLQPIVENAIFHGIAPKEEKGCIEVTVHREQDDAVIVIRDDGIGIDSAKLPHLLNGSSSTRASGMTRIGLSHVHQTLQLYFGIGYGVEVHSEIGQGTSVRLIIPIRKEDAYVQSAAG
ncbi:sensor histidine kinase [Paenibacillus sp. NPDC056579]|uniref:cache domain-containing sensor histidine kinase n=1 Tax=unclassified Paenibacillus TaxID=185978 RepID=UPI001EF8B95B|nr:sensor histidine kinase [Paenibacillus sp. H1-7]ULL17744.1 sensor histidine kinase [Paenibacillus sp. H1-7]